MHSVPLRRRVRQLEAFLDRPPEPARRVAQVLLVGQGVGVTRAVGGPVLGDEVPGHVAAKTGAGKQVDSNDFFLGARQLQALPAGAEGLRRFVDHDVLLRISHVREETALDQLFMRRLQLLIDLRYVGVRAYRDVLLQLENIHLPRRRTRTLEIYESVEPLGDRRIECPVELYVQAAKIVLR